MASKQFDADDGRFGVGRGFLGRVSFGQRLPAGVESLLPRAHGDPGGAARLFRHRTGAGGAADAATHHGTAAHRRLSRHGGVIMTPSGRKFTTAEKILDLMHSINFFSALESSLSSSHLIM